MPTPLECPRCDATARAADRPPACPSCGAALRVPFPDPDAPFPSNAGRHDAGRYAARLPVADGPSLGEGWTPVVDAPTVAPDGVTVRLKNETANPTFSWKDRAMSQLVPHAAALGHDRVAVASTGNQAASVAAYDAAAGTDCLALLNPRSEPPARAHLRARGADAVVLSDYGPRKELLAELADRGWFPAYDLPDRYGGGPVVRAGYRAIAYELVEQVGVPDAVAVPVGSGDGLVGIWEGFRALETEGVVDATPRLLAAEQAERAPLTRALDAGADAVGTDDGPVPLSVSTMGASAGDHALRAVRNSGGSAHAVAREAMADALAAAGRDGAFLEPSSALAPGAVRAAAEAGDLSAGEEVVAVCSGAGATWPGAVTEALGDVPTVAPTLDAVGDAVGRDLGRED